jgi:hypothetical protein
MKGWLACTILLCWACGGETAGESIVVRWTVEAADRDDDDRSFVTDTGWQVTLDEARLAIESMRAIAPDQGSVDAVAQLARWMVPVAHAHGGHDEATGRRISAEWIEAFVVDALARDRQALGGYGAEAGSVDLLKLALARVKTRIPEELDGFRAYVRGTAERDGESIAFAGGLDFADGESARRVEVPVRFELSEGGTLVLDVHASEWLREADFSRLPEAEQDAPREITPSTQVGRAWAIGIRSPAAFSMTWRPLKD